MKLSPSEIVASVITSVIAAAVFAAFKSEWFVFAPPLKRFLDANWPGMLVALPISAGLTLWLAWGRSGSSRRPTTPLPASSFPPRDYESDWRETLSEWRATLFAMQDLSAAKTFRGFRDHTYLDSGIQCLTTAQCVAALLESSSASGHGILAKEAASFRDAFDYLESARLSNGEQSQDQAASSTESGDSKSSSACKGEEGWGFVDRDPPAVTEISAWVVIAKLFALRSNFVWTESEVKVQLDNIVRDLKYLAKCQYQDGGWSPVFHVTTANVRTYATAMAVWSFAEALRVPQIKQRLASPGLDDFIKKKLDGGVDWLLRNRQRDRQGDVWVPKPRIDRAPQQKSYHGLTGQILYVLSRVDSITDTLRTVAGYKKAKEDFLKDERTVKLAVEAEGQMSADESYIELPGGKKRSLEAMSFLWFPWSTLAYRLLCDDESLSKDNRSLAEAKLQKLKARHTEVTDYIKNDDETFRIAESLFCMSQVFAPSGHESS
jgi:hypothetical protein